MSREASTAEAPSAARSLGPLLAGAALVIVAAWRARYGVSLLDSSHYTVVAMRLAQGARPFVDEMTLQATGFLLPALFAKAWMLAFGTTAIEFALRLAYVAVAAGAGVLVYRALEPTFGTWPSFAAAAVPLLSPPYNILALSYNTGALLGLTVAAALAFAAVRDGDARSAFGAGAALAFAAVSYPPLVVAALVGLASFAVAARRRIRLAAWMLAGGLALAVPVVAWLALRGSLAGIAPTFAYSQAAGGGKVLLGPLQRLGMFWPFAVEPFGRPSVWVACGLALVALLPPVPRLPRAAALAAAPLVLALPALRHIPADQSYVGGIPAGMLIMLTVILLVPLVVFTAEERRSDLGRLLLLAGPLGVTGMLLVVYSTNAAWSRGTAFAGLAPMAMAVLAGWGLFLREKGGRAVLGAATAALVVTVVVMLFATSFKDEPPLRLHTPLGGAYAGLLTTAQQAKDFADIASAGKRLVRPGATLAVLHAPGVYLLVPGRIEANAAWMYQGPSTAYALRYFEREGGLPDVVVGHARSRVPKPDEADPLLDVLARDYRREDSTRVFDLYVRR